MFSFKFSDTKIEPKMLHLTVEIDEEAVVREAKEAALERQVRDAVSDYITGLVPPLSCPAPWGRTAPTYGMDGHNMAIDKIISGITEDILKNTVVV
jgi:hypothetical protein